MVDPKLSPESFLLRSAIPLSNTTQISPETTRYFVVTAIHGLAEIVGDLVIQPLDPVLCVVELGQLELARPGLILHYVLQTDVALQPLIGFHGEVLQQLLLVFELVYRRVVFVFISAVFAQLVQVSLTILDNFSASDNLIVKLNSVV